MSPRRAWAVLVVLSLAAFAFITTELLPVGLLTHIAPDLDRSRSRVGMLVSGYAVVVVVASVPLARLTQRIPRRHLLGGTMILFAAANAAAALASTYAVLAGARLLTALAQALFWSIATATVTGPFPIAVRGRVVALFATGATLAPVLGVPLGTWIGQHAGWRTAFAVLAGVGLAIAAAVLILLPSYPPATGGAARGTAPDGRRFTVLLIATALGIGAASLIGMYALGALRPGAVAFLAGIGLAYAAFGSAVQSRMLQLAPGSTDIASAGVSTAFNAGIAGGSLFGGALLSISGARPLALVGGSLTLVALTLLAVDARRRHAATPAPAAAGRETAVRASPLPR
ncbi:MFS transporter [Micromonospora sp. WMMD710]|uniref:MFS transporter n=1 Tax=Micromonospora sp. WMMD710 TaxID=3016085 RepID=UPI0024167C27|nr:MFS transporter [Micromonospora sp. WMMD710]MDG4757299.1 MFS transporter [Micromonospora sp. WMMD710]